MDDLREALGTPIVGKNGQLYMRGGHPMPNVLRLYQSPLDPALILRWQKTLARRGRELKRRGIPYVFLFGPAAHFACAENLPDDIAGTLLSPVEAFLAAVGPIDNVVIDNPTQRLRQDSGGFPVWRPTDTHWSEYGAYLAYRSACDAMRGLVDVGMVPPEDVTFTMATGYGDLAVHQTPEGPPERTPKARIARHHEARMVRENVTFYRNRVREFVSPTAPPGAALFFHDSFLTAQAPFWARSFRRSHYVGITHRVFLDAVDAIRPDVVVSMMTEPSLYRIPNDHDVWTFADEFESDCRSPAGVQAMTILRLYRQTKLTEAADATAGLPDRPGFGAYHARVAAQALVTAHRYEQALAMARVALEAEPRHASYLWMAAYAEAYHGNPADAVTLATWANEVDPCNGAWAQLLASLLIGLGRWDDAATLLEPTIQTIDDNVDLWQSLATVRAARGDAAGAAQAAAMVEAFTLTPTPT